MVLRDCQRATYVGGCYTLHNIDKFLHVVMIYDKTIMDTQHGNPLIGEVAKNFCSYRCVKCDGSACEPQLERVLAAGGLILQIGGTFVNITRLSALHYGK